MHTARLVALLKAQATSTDQKEKMAYKKNQASSIKKLTHQCQSRALDNFDVIDKKLLEKLCSQYKKIVEEIHLLATQHAEYKKIQTQNPNDLLSDPILASRLTSLQKDIQNPSIKEQLINFLNEIIHIGCKELLDGHNRVRWDVINQLKWSPFKKTLHGEQLVESFVNSVIAEMMLELNAFEMKTELRVVLDAVNMWLSREYKALTKLAITETQKDDFYCQFASETVEQLSKLEKPTLRKYQTDLSELVSNDLKQAKENVNIHRQKIRFWINVIYEAGISYQRNALVTALWPIVMNNLSVNSSELDYVDVSEVHIAFLGAEHEKRYEACEALVKTLPALDAKPHQNEKLDETVKLEINKRLLLRDKNSLVDEIMKEYLAINLKSNEEEKKILQNLIEASDDRHTLSVSVGQMLDNAIKACDTELLRENRLAKILKKYSNLFVAEIIPEKAPSLSFG